MAWACSAAISDCMNAATACAGSELPDEEEDELDWLEEPLVEELELPPTPKLDKDCIIALMKPPPGGGPACCPAMLLLAALD